MRYRLKITLLTIGAVLGLAGGIHHLARRHHPRVEERLTRICGDAARQACGCQSTGSTAELAPAADEDPPAPQP